MKHVTRTEINVVLAIALCFSFTPSIAAACDGSREEQMIEARAFDEITVGMPS
ncbi:MAG: hypothetical protein RR178_00010 [Gordonibacter sp.]